MRMQARMLANGVRPFDEPNNAEGNDIFCAKVPQFASIAPYSTYCYVFARFGRVATNSDS